MSEVIRINLKSNAIKVKLMDEVKAASFQQPSEEDLIKNQLQNYYEKGFSDGQNAIRLELEKEFTSRLIEKTEEFSTILLSLEENLKNYEQAFDNIIIEVSIAVAEKILKREIAKESIITTSLRDSIRKVLGANEILIKINPKDHKILNDESSSLLLEESFSKIKFEHDERVDPGGCFVETEIGNVDSRISTQLSEIKKQLENTFNNTIN